MESTVYSLGLTELSLLESVQPATVTIKLAVVSIKLTLLFSFMHVSPRPITATIAEASEAGHHVHEASCGESKT